MGKISQEDYTKALETISRFERQCSKCGTEFGDGWGWTANSFVLNLNIDSQSTTALFGDRADEIGFKHPAIRDGAGFQNLTIESSKDLPYRLCPKCHREFVKLVGDFLLNSL